MPNDSTIPFIDALFADLQACPDLESIRTAVAARLAQARMTYFAYAVFVTRGTFDIDPCTITTYPDDWSQRYVRESLDRIDPVVQQAVATAQPFFWSWRDPVLRTDPAAADFLDAAARHGVRTGFTAPIQAPRGVVGLLSFASDGDWDDRDAYARHWYHDLSLAVMYVHNAVARVQARETVARANLTDREYACLSWAAAGKTAWETATILGRSPRTVEYHLNNARRKLDADNIKAAIQKAVTAGLVT